MEFDFDTDLILENDRSRLEPLTEDHFEALLPIALAYPDLLRYSPSSFGDEGSLKAYFGAALMAKALEERYPFAIFDKQNETYAGSTSFGNISDINQRLEIGWTWIGAGLQRTGLNRNNKFLMLRYGFETLGFKRIEFKSDSRNKQSRRAMEAIGASYEGTLRSHTIMPDGYRRDTVYYSILQEEWMGIKESVFKGI